MANRAYLFNTDLGTSDPHRIREMLGHAGYVGPEIAIAAYRIPFSWLCCFRQGDLRTFEWRPEAAPDDDDPDLITTALPVVAEAQAIANLRESRPLFEAATGETTISHQYWQRAVDALEALPLP